MVGGGGRGTLSALLSGHLNKTYRTAVVSRLSGRAWLNSYPLKLTSGALFLWILPPDVFYKHGKLDSEKEARKMRADRIILFIIFFFFFVKDSECLCSPVSPSFFFFLLSFLTQINVGRDLFLLFMIDLPAGVF